MQLGIGGWQVPRDGVQEARKRNTNVLTIADIEKIGLDKTAEIALELAWKDADAVYISFDVDSIDCGFVPGTGWPEPGGFLPREALKLLGLVAAEGLCGLEVVEVSPPYDTSDITALVGVRVVVEALGSMVAHGKLGSHKKLIDKPVAYWGARRCIRDTITIITTTARRSGAGAGHNHVAADPRHGAVADAASAARSRHDTRAREPDLDLVEMAFVEGFATAKDPASFLRLARIPFEAADAPAPSWSCCGSRATRSPMSAR